MKLKKSPISFIKGENNRHQVIYHLEYNVNTKRKSTYACQSDFCRLKVSDLPPVQINKQQKIYKKEL